jgi:hypothetical protein
MEEQVNEKLRSFIQNTVSLYWEKNKSAYLLSALGVHLRRELPAESGTLEKGLRRFLLDWPIVQIVDHPIVKEKIGVVPLYVRLPDNTADIFPETSSVSAIAPRFRFLPEFWRAFHTPIDGRRYVVLPVGNDPVRIIETQNGSGIAGKEILSRDLAEWTDITPHSERIKLISEKIQSWLDRNGLDKSTFVATPTRTQVSFALALESLSADDQARISIPLDIVMKIFHERK